ncbi:MAG: gamma-glutamyl-gamma-aminobutyrate hydrolase family protein [Geminicoccaceae bacterium]|nr:gamma-glutamyl-gamma-aminobutyrate hydrolase family protein [Geminicoccaceae bacterium]
MERASALPLVGISCCRKPVRSGTAHAVVDKYIDAVVEGGGLPVLIPALGDRLDIEALLDRLDGLLLTGSLSNVGHEHYRGPVPRWSDTADADRDATTLPLIRACVERGTPILAICRGIQELNVALGGSLHQHVHELPGRRDHRSNKTLLHAERYLPVHEIVVTPGSVLSDILRGAARIRVNSLHAQAVDRLGTGLVVEARADDETIEAVALADRRRFCIGVQWHAEWRLRDHPHHMALFRAFADACAVHSRRKAGDDRPGSVARGTAHHRSRVHPG